MCVAELVTCLSEVRVTRVYLSYLYVHVTQLWYYRCVVRYAF